MKYRCLLILLLASCLLVSGCIQQKTIDQILLVQSAAFDASGAKLLETMGVTTYSNKKGGQLNTYTAKGNTVEGLMEEIDGRTPKKVLKGQLRVALIGKKLARHGMSDIVATFSRDTMIGTASYAAVVDGRATDLLKRNNTDGQLPSDYISGLLRQNMKTQNLPTSNLHYFLYHMRGHGSDPVLPLLKEYQGHVILEGLALFDGDHYVDKIDYDHLFYFKRLFEDSKQGNHEIVLRMRGKKAHVNVREMTSHQDYHFHHLDTAPEATINVKINGRITEFTKDVNLEKESNLDAIEKQMQAEFEKQSEALIHRLQKKQIDPLAIGMKARHKMRGWNAQKWADIYPRMKFHVNADVQIVHSGGNK